METVGQRIRKLRKENNWTQPQLASRVNVSPQVISNWERGYTRPDADDVARLAKVFNVKADYILLGRIDDPPSPIRKDKQPDELTTIMYHKWNQLDERRRKQALKMIEILEQEADEENNKG